MTGLLRNELRTGTQDLHVKAETQTQLGALSSESFTVENYRTILKAFHQVHQHLESELKKVSELSSILPDLEERWKLASLQKDLALAQDLQSISFPFGNFNLSQALGVLYVLEGSTLGGQVILKNLKQKSGFESEDFHYYNHYGLETGKYWQIFLSTLEKASQSGRINSQECVQAARHTFELIIQSLQ